MFSAGEEASANLPARRFEKLSEKSISGRDMPNGKDGLDRLLGGSSGRRSTGRRPVPPATLDARNGA